MSTTVVRTETTTRELRATVPNGSGPSFPVVKTLTKKVYNDILVWRNVIIFLYVHAAAVYGLFTTFQRVRFYTFAFTLFVGMCGGMGITAGAHRLWAHKSYKAKWPLRVLLGIFQTIAFQNHIYEWARDHRVHHKFSETDADPHNAKRGFFFSHMGWLLVKKHPDVLEKGKSVPMKDLEDDFVVVLQRKFYLILMPIIAFAIPTYIPVYFWGEDPWVAWHTTLIRWVLSLNCTWLVNSAAHLWGNKPYDKNISPSENISVAVLAYGEGWHNYHHVFPYDYKAAELAYFFNPTTAFIDFFAKIGWAYDLKTISEDVIRKRIERTGDGTHQHYGNNNSIEGDHHHDHEEHVWGWGDKDMKEEDYKSITFIDRVKQK